MQQNPSESDAPLPSMNDEQTLQCWMHLYGDVVLRTAALLLRDSHLAEDVSQECFLKAYQKRHQLADPSKARSWLLRITVNLCHSRMRKHAWSRLTFSHMLEGWIGQKEPSSPGPDETVPLQASVIELIGQLPYADREVIVLFYYQSLSIEEMSQCLQQSSGTIKSRLSRARIKLRKAWERSEGDG